MPVRICKSNNDKLHDFLANAGNALQTFRYFNKRKLSVIENHLVTYLILDENETPVCYGHLERENEILWLGIAVIESQKGKGLGNQMMKYLLEFAKINNEKQITLSVDKTNSNAIKLYLKFGFTVFQELENIIIMKKQIE